MEQEHGRGESERVWKTSSTTFQCVNVCVRVCLFDEPNLTHQSHKRIVATLQLLSLLQKFADTARKAETLIEI